MAGAHRADAHNLGGNACGGHREHPGQNGRADFPGLFLAHKDHAAGRVVHAGGVARGNAAVRFEGGLELLQRRQAGIPPGILVGGDDGVALFALDGHGDDFLREPARVLCGNRPLLGAQGEGVLLLPGDAVLFSHVFRRDAHGRAYPEVCQGVPHGVPQVHMAELLPVARVEDHVGGGAHAVGAAGQDAVGLSRLDLIKAQLDGGHGGGAVAVDGDAGHAFGQTGLHQRHPG
ncbi:hypothetical protein SDC9_135993 [bioreactor metagenome]|uniref:Uncharacterized protein n=1 Tax=bioreactor metagenome TaxID=1076179 RepID=A0A645DHW6_9ZZZZ